MDNTNCGANCAFVQSGFCKSDKDCPNFVQTFWQQEGNPTPQIVSDCYPKKFAVENNRLLHRCIAMQSVIEGLNHKVERLESAINQLCCVFASQIAKNHENNLKIDNKEILKTIE